ncbi:hypothetical protein DDB_G0294396 [Dictyostelium discoideum AX4]|uniref:Uncharacterized protein n=1 Tax=Dictyostelium discoideum TaxID=44689 RepID=Q54AJ8_DICDI|nr:hypothetical protein DDB_G0294396 [Dictyostelium discoideum AX4]EAL60291.1 hypothetical protein DDB_G0294396 [Dictyostelium discoideum AX4]|eukprot:XP_628704.1 hypothetical protein DDB_G0294396 [Dictyostelium discoideum AX4]
MRNGVSYLMIPNLLKITWLLKNPFKIINYMSDCRSASLVYINA